MVRAFVALTLVAAVAAWEPEPCDQLPKGEPCRTLYKHPPGSKFVGQCPQETWANADGCSASAEGKPVEEHCPQIECPVALGITMKLVCGGGCCPTCWAPDHHLSFDRHFALENPATVPTHPSAPAHCAGAKCFKAICAEGEAETYVDGSCCFSCAAR